MSWRQIGPWNESEIRLADVAAIGEALHYLATAMPGHGAQLAERAGTALRRILDGESAKAVQHDPVEPPKEHG